MNQLMKLRKKIDTFDQDILNLLGLRFSLTKKIQKMKKQKRLSLMRKSRENAIVKKLESKAKSKNLPPKLIHEIYRSIFRYSKRSP